LVILEPCGGCVATAEGVISKQEAEKSTESRYAEKTVRFSRQLELLTGLETRVTIFGRL